MMTVENYMTQMAQRMGKAMADYLDWQFKMCELEFLILFWPPAAVVMGWDEE